MEDCVTLSDQNDSKTCNPTNWLAGESYWFISYIAVDKFAWFVDGGAHPGINGVSESIPPKPSVYLSSSVKIIAGTGTSDNPYLIDENTGVSTDVLEKRSFIEKGTTEKTVTVTYPSGCGSTLTCTYQKDNGEVVEVTTETVEVPFTEDGNIVGTLSDGTNTVSSTYTVQLERTISIGTVKGGSITLDKETALLTENVNITSTATTDFAYKGATIVCEDGSTHTITGKTFNMSTCNSPVTVYPTWKKNTRVLFQTNSLPFNPTFSQVLVDVSGTGTCYNGVAPDGNKYYLQFKNENNLSRVQMTSTSSIDITDYSSMSMNTWCSKSKNTMMLGITYSKDSWVHNQNYGGVYGSKYNITTDNFNCDIITCDISNKTGNWYISVERLYNADVNSNFCNVNYIHLYGNTYSYTNRGV